MLNIWFLIYKLIFFPLDLQSYLSWSALNLRIKNVVVKMGMVILLYLSPKTMGRILIN